MVLAPTHKPLVLKHRLVFHEQQWAFFNPNTQVIDSPVAEKYVDNKVNGGYVNKFDKGLQSFE